MLLKITLPVLILTFNISTAQTQYFEAVEKESERILIPLSDGDSLDPSELSNLENLLASPTEINSTESDLNISRRSIDSLRSHLAEFESGLKNISTDSAFVLFNDWYLHFQNLFYDYSKEKFFSSTKEKILLFSTSMSCYCTLKMSREQTAGLLEYISENEGKYDYLIVDSYWHNDLQIKYETFFAPSVLVFDGNNQLLYKIEYDENMIALLSHYLTNLNN